MMLLKRNRKVDSRALCAVAVAVALSKFAGSAYSQVVTYTSLDLEVKGQTALTAFSLNNSDQVVGFTFSADYNGNPKAGTELPFVYTPGGSGTGFTAIPGLTGSSSSAATGINNAGVIVGNDGNTGQGFVYTPSSSTLTEVSPLAGSTLTFSGVNNNGVAVGTSSTSSGGNTVITYNISSGHTTDVGTGFTGSGNVSYATAINDSGTVLGLGTASSPTNSNPAHFQPFTATPTGGTYSYTNVGNSVEAAIHSGTSNAGYFLMQGLSAGGDVAGTVGGTSTGAYKPSLSNPTGYLYNGSSGAVTNFGNVQDASAVADVNGSPEVVGSGYTYNPATLGHEYDAFTYTASGGMVDIAHIVPNYYLTNAISINSNGDILAQGYPSGSNSLRYLLLTANVIPSVTYTGAVSNSFDTSTANFSPTKYANGDYVTFDDSATGSTTVNIPASVSPGSLVFNNSSKSYVLNGASVTGGSSTTLSIKSGGAVTLNNANTYTGFTNISSGSLTIGSTGSLASNNITLLRNGSMTILSGGALTSTALNLSLGNGSHFVVAATTPDKVVLQLASLTDYGVPLDLNNTDMILHNYAYNVSGSTSLIASGYAGGTWSGNGIVSTSAKNDPTHLTTLGTIQNSQDGTPTGTKLYSTFDGVAVVSSDVLVKYTYYGDANLDGQVDGSDYSLIDAAYNANQSGDSLPITGWYNGDFNYDGVIDGSDYTLIDNAFNMQGAGFPGSFTSVLATAEIASGSSTAAVPEPATLSLLGVGALGLLKRRQR